MMTEILTNQTYESHSLRYAQEKLYLSVLILATGTGSLRKRLANAYNSQLMRLLPGDVPSHMRETLQEITGELTKKEAEHRLDTRAAASTRTMHYLKAQRLAKQIVSMYDQLVCLGQSSEAPPCI